jgi:hypothetical protein
MACGREVILHRFTLRIYAANLNSTNILVWRTATLVPLGECSALRCDSDTGVAVARRIILRDDRAIEYSRTIILRAFDFLNRDGDGLRSCSALAPASAPLRTRAGRCDYPRLWALTEASVEVRGRPVNATGGRSGTQCASRVFSGVGKPPFGCADSKQIRRLHKSVPSRR